MVWGDYWIVGLGDDYRWAVVGDPDREYLWILSRTPSLDETLMQQAEAAARAQGFDLEKLQPTRNALTH
jgi:apolipoprotein D and lipocalin family protein